MKCKIMNISEAVTDIEKLITFSESVLKMEEKMLYKPWGVSSLIKNSVFLKCEVPTYILAILICAFSNYIHSTSHKWMNQKKWQSLMLERTSNFAIW